jgi:predicted ATPase/two-component SAPR family response regulator
MPLTVDPLPVRLSALVGRESELGDIGRSLAGCRLLTLTGPGGVGKTRLAIAAASSAIAAGRFPAGVCWVELAAVDDPAIVPRIVAARLGVPDASGQDAAQAIAAHIAGHPVLIVMDNCEHLVAETACLTEFLLAACPALAVLATSREPLGVEGELNWPVPPLSLPAPSAPGATSASARSDAVRLFEQRARLVRPSFRLSDDNADAIARICRRLDGLPLAIELAAARMRALSPVQLAQRLDDIFAVLVGGARSAPVRHRTLRATLDWSHHMLAADERAVFRRLAEFAGGFTLDAAEQIAAGGGIGTKAMLELLTRLADKSLLQVDHVGGHDGEAARYRLLATIRDYAAERLAEAAETAGIRGAHLRYYAEFAEGAAARIESAGARTGRTEVELDRLDAELPNLRRAFEYAVESDDPVASRRIACSLRRYANLRGHYAEVLQWLDVDAPADGAVAAPTASVRPAMARRGQSSEPVTSPLRIKALGGAVVELGDVTLTAADWGYAKPRELLFLLATSPAMTRDQIGATLWPDLSSRQLRNALHTALRELRRALGDAGWVSYRDGRYAFDRTRPHTCDVTAFEDALAAARRARPSAAGLPDLQRAIAAYDGDFLDGMPAGDWALDRRDELRRAFESALLATGRMLTAAGRHQAAASAFRRAVTHEPLNESAHRELMMCWVNLGQGARAVRHYKEFADRLRDQLGIPPAAETTALYRQLITTSESGARPMPGGRPNQSLGRPASPAIPAGLVSAAI